LNSCVGTLGASFHSSYSSLPTSHQASRSPCCLYTLQGSLCSSGLSAPKPGILHLSTIDILDQTILGAGCWGIPVHYRMPSAISNLNSLFMSLSRHNNHIHIQTHLPSTCALRSLPSAPIPGKRYRNWGHRVQGPLS
jgi:hypothetical protein